MNLFYRIELVNLLEFPQIEIDVIDICIMKFIANHYMKSDGKNSQRKGYMITSKKSHWVKIKTKYLIDSNPYLKLKDGESLKRRLDKLQNYGFIERDADLSMKHRCSCYRMGYLYKLLMGSESLSETDKKNIRTFLRNIRIPNDI